ncbi:carbohydrate ABC transporter permease [Halosegnis marinus]|uniref:carbohydrate ABC transporter permease n=1 Tax=Halosegnis marinus TaxID=3034023 RepID=UPI00360A14C1
MDSETLLGIGSVLPVILLYLVVSIIPVGFAVYASLHEIPLLNPNWTWIGLENYGRVFEVDRFWGSLGRGVIFMVGSTVLQLVVGLWMAMTLNRIRRGQKIITAVVFTAYLIPTIVVTLMTLFMLNTQYGVLHMIGSEWLGIWEPTEFALGQNDLAMPIVVLVGTWKFSVFITIFTLAQLRSIPQRFYEAAKVCGANKWEMFRDVTLPGYRASSSSRSCSAPSSCSTSSTSSGRSPRAAPATRRRPCRCSPTARRTTHRTSDSPTRWRS